MNLTILQSEGPVAVPTSELVSEANHRISNHLGLLTSILHTQINGIDKGPEHLSRETVKCMLQATVGRLVSVSRLHHRLSQQSGLDTFLSDHVVEVCAALVSSLSLNERVYFAYTWAADCRLSPEQAQYVGMLINEITINALKYAHPTGLPVQLEIRCERDPNGRVAIIISDDGVGLPEGNKESAAGLGFKLIRALTKSLNAELRIESDSLGLTFVVTLPPAVFAVKCLSIVEAN